MAPVSGPGGAGWGGPLACSTGGAPTGTSTRPNPRTRQNAGSGTQSEVGRHEVADVVRGQRSSRSLLSVLPPHGYGPAVIESDPLRGDLAASSEFGPARYALSAVMPASRCGICRGPHHMWTFAQRCVTTGPGAASIGTPLTSCRRSSLSTQTGLTHHHHSSERYRAIGSLLTPAMLRLLVRLGPRLPGGLVSHALGVRQRVFRLAV